jgi:hypothetical protein
MLAPLDNFPVRLQQIIFNWEKDFSLLIHILWTIGVKCYEEGNLLFFAEFKDEFVAFLLESLSLLEFIQSERSTLLKIQIQISVVFSF